MRYCYDRTNALAAYLDDAGNFFDLRLEWRAFAYAGGVWSTGNRGWLGTLRAGNVYDPAGRLLLWSDAPNLAPGAATARPPVPPRPPRPARPIRPPARPAPVPPAVAYWSNLKWNP
jgi:hypothetical protein